MGRRQRLWLWVAALAVVAGGCSSDGFDPGVEGEAAEPEQTAEPTSTSEPSATPTPAVDRVQILSGTVSDLGDRRDLTFTVDDVGGLTTTPVPDVIGLLVDDASDDLSDAGFFVYRVETFPPTDDMDRVVDMWPPPGLDFVEGVNVFLKLDGPLDALPVEVGDELTGVINGRQVLAFDPFENWLIRVWLDDPIAVDPLDLGAEQLTIGREVELRAAGDDIACLSGEALTDPTALPPDSAISFTLAADPAEDIRFRPPERIAAASITVDCG